MYWLKPLETSLPGTGNQANPSASAAVRFWDYTSKPYCDSADSVEAPLLDTDALLVVLDPEATSQASPTCTTFL